MRVSLPYHKPHSFRHGHAVYSIQLADDVSDLKAISMNFMHDSLTVTEKIYGVFSSLDVKTRIQNFGSSRRAGKEAIKKLLTEILDSM